MPMFLLIISALIKYGPAVYNIVKLIWDLIKQIRDSREKQVATQKLRGMLKGRFVGGELLGMLENFKSDLESSQAVAQRRKKR